MAKNLSVYNRLQAGDYENGNGGKRRVSRLTQFIHATLQFQLQLCNFLFFSFSFSYSFDFSVTFTVIVFQFLFQLVILHKIGKNA